MDPRVTAVLEAQKQIFTDLGCIVEDAEPDFTGATEAFETLRAVGFVASYGALLQDAPRRAEGHGDLERRAGPASAAPSDIARAERAAHGALPAHARVPRAATSSSSAR